MEKTCVLIADNEVVIADSLALILERKGFAAHAAYSGEAAVAWAKEHQPDIFLSDIHMGPVNGIEAATFIRDRFPACRILLFSGHPESLELLAKAREGGYTFDAMPKPVHPQTVLDWVTHARRGVAAAGAGWDATGWSGGADEWTGGR